LNPGAALRIVRPVNCAMIGFAVIVGEFVSKPSHVPLAGSLFGFLTGFFVCAYSMVVNDVYDAEVDAINQPSRPIPSGKVSIESARRLSIASLLAGAAFSVMSLSWIAVGIALVYALLSWTYNAKAKKTGLAGNAIVASSLAIPFVYGGVIVGGAVLSPLLLMMALTAFSSGVGREVVKAMSDVEGDAKRGIRSVAISRGQRTAAAVGAAFFILAVLTSWGPIALGAANAIYTYGVVIPDVVFAYLAASILRRSDAKNAHVVKNRALLGMLVGLFVFVGGAF
jgi:geranylgeranylglycerol-phosphate geranylgeranyltransferase